MRKTKLIISLLILLLISVFVTGVLLISQKQGAKAQTPTIYINSCQVLNQVNTTYILDNDVSSAGTCFQIAADGITLDLNGKTVTYNTKAGDYDCSAYTTAGTLCSYGIMLRYWTNINTSLKITNGNIAQGSGTGTYSDAIFLRHGNMPAKEGIEISNLNITIQTKDTRGIRSDGGNNFNIHHNNFTSNVGEITNRHAYDGYVIQMASISNSNIHNNKIVGGQGGIAVSGLSDNVSIYNNDISHRAVGTNAYGVILYNPWNTRVYENYVHTNDGTGIMADGAYRNVEIYNNTVDIKYGCKEEEYGCSMTAWGMKFRTYPDSARGGLPPSNLKVYNNKITAATEPGLVNYAAGIGIYDSHENLNNEYFNNDITAITTAPDKTAAGIINAGVETSNTGTKVYNNIIRSNNTNIRLTSNDGVGQHGLQWLSNALIKAENPINYHTLTVGFWTFATENHTFLDTKTLNGADIDDVGFGTASGGDDYSLYVKWYLDILVKDSTGQAISEAAVSAAATAGGTENLSAITDASGRARLELTEYFRYGKTYPATSNYTHYTPHNITISKSGLSTETKSLTMNASKEMTIILDGQDAEPPIISAVTASVNQETKTAIITWQTDRNADSKVEYGLDSSYGQVKADSTMKTNHSIQIINLISPATYHFRVSSQDSAGLKNVGVNHTLFLLGVVDQGLTLSKQVDKASASSGDTLTYTITYANGSEVSDNLQIQDLIPAGATYVSGSAKLNGQSKTDSQDGDEFYYDSANRKAVWSLGTLLVGATGSVSFQARVE